MMKRNWRAGGVLVLFALLAVLLLLKGGFGRIEIVAASRLARNKPSGQPQLISVQALPSAEGEACEWMPASANASESIALEQEAPSNSNATRTLGDARTAVETDPAPIRVIRDTYSTYSAVAVDPVRNEIVLQDENLFQIMVYDRSANTPQNATMTEPKRVIGGHNTKLEFNCALYIDPQNGDIYSVNNDTMDNTVIFSHDARGNATPTRELFTPHGSYGIAVDEQKQELFITVEHTNAVVVYPKMAQGDEKPLRIIQGEHTGLEDPHGVAVDSRNQLLYVSNHGNARNPGGAGGAFRPPSITVYPLNGSGDAAPLRVIKGDATKLDWPAQIYLDAEKQELFVANDADDSVLVFRAASNGDAAPARMLKGPKTGIKNPTGLFVDTKNNELVVSNMGNHSATIYPRSANGDIAPVRTIRNAPKGKLALAIGNPGAAGYDSKRDEILVPN